MFFAKPKIHFVQQMEFDKAFFFRITTKYSFGLFQELEVVMLRAEELWCAIKLNKMVITTELSLRINYAQKTCNIATLT